MIVLSSEREIIKVETWGDITDRPGFTGNLDPTAHTLHAIIGRYAFAEWVPCGLSNCHTPHGKGYIVVTKDGQETNIGRDCGKSYFGVDFETMSAKFDRDIAEKENRERLWSFFFRMDEVVALVRKLRDGDRGGDWVYRMSRPLLNANRDVPTAVVRRIGQMVKAREPMLTMEREATEREYQEMVARAGRGLPRPQVVSIAISVVEGIDALYPENDIRNLLVIELEERLRQLESVNIDTLDGESLRKWARWISGVDETAERAAAAIEKGQRLLTNSNLFPFGDATDLSTQDLQLFKRYLKQLPNGRAATDTP